MRIPCAPVSGGEFCEGWLVVTERVLDVWRRRGHQSPHHPPDLPAGEETVKVSLSRLQPPLPYHLWHHLGAGSITVTGWHDVKPDVKQDLSDLTWTKRTLRNTQGTPLCFENKNQRVWLAEQYLSTNRGPIIAAENHLSNSRQLKQNKGCEVVKDRAARAKSKWSIASSQGYPRRSWRRYSGT